MANRRIGVEHSVKEFECPGSRELPEPNSRIPTIDESANHIQELRPDFRADARAESVKVYLELVMADVEAAWASGQVEGLEGMMVDRKKIRESVEVYWTRLAKRYDEQVARERGLVHKDELVRRKQNQYRRQQSLLARRVAAFDESPLNACKLRSLYRTLLTIDFAPKTEERPDPRRTYSEAEWYAYRKAGCGSKAEEAHEVVDQFWMSDSVRTLLAILDTFANDQSSRQRRKGRPKAPAPTFHLPRDLWDRSASSLPTLRYKDSRGLPVPGVGGVILYKFQVDENVQRQFPEWAKGLYDNPPIPVAHQQYSDEIIGGGQKNLSEVLDGFNFAHLKGAIKALRAEGEVRRLSVEEIQEINARPAGDFDLGNTSTSAAGAGGDQSARIGSGSGSAGEFDLSLHQQQQQDQEFTPLPLHDAAGFTIDMTSSNINAGLNLDGFVGVSESSPYMGHSNNSGQNQTLSSTGVASTNPSIGLPHDTLATSTSSTSSPMIVEPYAFESHSRPDPTTSRGKSRTQVGVSGSSSTSDPDNGHVAGVKGIGGGGGGAGSGSSGSKIPVAISLGSSKRARMMNKRSGRELPGGAAMPVAKRSRRNLHSGSGGGGGDGNGDGDGEEGREGQGEGRDLGLDLGVDVVDVDHDLELDLGVDLDIGLRGNGVGGVQEGAGDGGGMYGHGRVGVDSAAAAAGAAGGGGGGGARGASSGVIGIGVGAGSMRRGVGVGVGSGSGLGAGSVTGTGASMGMGTGVNQAKGGAGTTLAANASEITTSTSGSEGRAEAGQEDMTTTTTRSEARGDGDGGGVAVQDGSGQMRSEDVGAGLDGDVDVDVDVDADVDVGVDGELRGDAEFLHDL